MSLQRASSLDLSSSGNTTSYRYKAITRDLLYQVTSKHFARKATGASISGSNRKARQAAQAAQQGGEDDLAGGGNLQTHIEPLEHYLKRATHLQLDHLKLSHTFVVPELAQASGLSPNDHTFEHAKCLRVLYLHDNHISTLDDFSFCKDSLSHLYLNQNHIGKMEHLLQLQHLEKLYLGGNQIQMLEGFAKEEYEFDEQQHQQEQQAQSSSSSRPSSSMQPRRPPVEAPAPFYLVELHLDSQRLPPDISFQLSIPSIQALASSLTILTLAGNQMDSDSILPISLLSRLTTLNLAQNRIDDLKILEEMCTYLNELTNLDLRENPINSGPQCTSVIHKKYRDRIIMSSRAITKLDEKDVPDNQREFLHSLMEQKRLKRAAAAANANKPREMTEEEKKFAALHLPPKFVYAPKVLTLRTTPIAGSINVSQLGGMGAGARHTLTHPQQHHTASSSSLHSHQQQSAHQHRPASSPFDDDDPNLGGGGGFDDGIYDDERQQPQAPQQQDAPVEQMTAAMLEAKLAEGDPIPGLLYKGDTKRLDYLLQTRGLVSAFPSTSSSTSTGVSDSLHSDDAAAESARVRRASMNALNQRPVGWDGGHSASTLLPTHIRKGSSPTRQSR